MITFRRHVHTWSPSASKRSTRASETPARTRAATVHPSGVGRFERRRVSVMPWLMAVSQPVRSLFVVGRWPLEAAGATAGVAGRQPLGSRFGYQAEWG